MDSIKSSNYHDVAALSQLRNQAHIKPDQAIEKVAQQFESVFVGMMLKAMRETVPEGGLFGDEATKTFEQMLDSQLSVTLSEGGGIGLAPVIARQLKGNASLDTVVKPAVDAGADAMQLQLHQQRSSSLSNGR
jgi:flagellar protein FlgJ